MLDIETPANEQTPDLPSISKMSNYEQVVKKTKRRKRIVLEEAEVAVTQSLTLLPGIGKSSSVDAGEATTGRKFRVRRQKTDYSMATEEQQIPELEVISSA